MIRTLMAVAGLVAFGSSALGQNTDSSLLPVHNLKDAGTYHLATGEWTRGEPSIAMGSYDTIYDNTCNGAWYTSKDWYRMIDDGRIPSTSSPQIDQGALGSGLFDTTSLIGTDDAYSINWFEFAYCTAVVAPMTAELSFWECYSSCSDVITSGNSPAATFQLSALPGSPTAGTLACWTVSIDLLGSSAQFTLQGDCDGVWDGSAAVDNFGYSYIQLTRDLAAISGPILAGDPDGLLLDGPGLTGCCVGCNTAFWAGANVPGTNIEGSGLNNADNYERNDWNGVVYTYNGCYWWGGYSATAPHSDIHMEIKGETSPGGEPGMAYCFGNTAQGNACPCANDNDQTDLAAGCANGTFAAGAHLGAVGSASVSNDTLVLMGTRGQPSNSSMFFQAINNLDGGGIFLGDGMRCAGGNLKRLKVKLNDVNGDADTTGTVITARSAALGYTILAGDILRYQWWYRDNNNPPCGLGVNDSNTSNGYEIVWAP